MQDEVAVRDIGALTVPRIGRIERCAAVPAVLVLDASGEAIEPVDRFLRSLVAGHLAPTTVYSHATALLRWWRFLAAVEVAWDRVTRVEVRDFVLWLRATRVKPTDRIDTGGRVGFASATINHNLSVVASRRIAGHRFARRNQAGYLVGCRTERSMTCSRRWATIGIGRCWRSSCRPWRGPPSCWGLTIDRVDVGRPGSDRPRCSRAFRARRPPGRHVRRESP